jgi:hypothetical protein
MSEVVAIITPVARSPLTYAVGMAMHTYTVEARDRGINVVWIHTKHYGVAEARERGVEDALNLGATKVLFWDDDIVPDINPITAFVFARAPMACGIYYEKTLKGLSLYLKRGDKFVNLKPRDVERLAKRSFFFPVDVCGLGLAMIDADIFRKLPKPWFSMQYGMGEDFYFFLKVRQVLGLRPIVLPNVTARHVLDSRFYLTADGKYRMGNI